MGKSRNCRPLKIGPRITLVSNCELWCSLQSDQCIRGCSRSFHGGNEMLRRKARTPHRRVQLLKMDATDCALAVEAGGLKGGSVVEPGSCLGHCRRSRTIKRQSCPQASATRFVPKTNSGLASDPPETRAPSAHNRFQRRITQPAPARAHIPS
jgi:hypothetical protein